MDFDDIFNQATNVFHTKASILQNHRGNVEKNAIRRRMRQILEKQDWTWMTRYERQLSQLNSFENKEMDSLLRGILRRKVLQSLLISCK